jgi:uncharacterized protein (TIGR00269 family)
MMRYKDTIGLAVSGGKDSLSLLYVLSKLLPKHGEKIIVITVDEGIHKYRDEALDIAEKLVSEKGLRHEIVSFKSLFGYTLDEIISIRKDNKTSACAICGILRRRAIDIAGSRLGVNAISTAHNLDDFLQTFLINLSSGDTNRLRFLNPRFRPNLNIPYRVKPFTEIFEEEIAFFAFLSEIPFQTISCPYMNEGIRTEIREFLNLLEKKHPGIKYNIFNTTLKLTTSTDQITSKKCERCSHPSSGEICSTCKIIELIQNKQI